MSADGAAKANSGFGEVVWLRGMVTASGTAFGSGNAANVLVTTTASSLGRLDPWNGCIAKRLSHRLS